MKSNKKERDYMRPLSNKAAWSRRLKAIEELKQAKREFVE